MVLVFDFLRLLNSSSLLFRQLQFSPEEVLGMVLNYSRSLAEDFAGEYQGGVSGSKVPICTDCQAGALLSLSESWPLA